MSSSSLNTSTSGRRPSYSHPARPHVLAVLTPQEQEHFLPGDAMRELGELAGTLTLADSTKLDQDTLAELLQKTHPDVLLACWKTPPLPAEPPPSLRYVCYLAGSVRKLVTRRHVENGLLVTTWGNSISRTVAECALLLVLACLRRVNGWTLDMHLRGAWKAPDFVTHSLFGRRVGLHGFGRISQNLAELLKPFDVQISALSPSVTDDLLAKHGVARATSLEELFSGSEIIVELAGLTPRSQYSVREEHLRMIPEPGVFVNVGRGAVVEPEGLLRVAREGRIQFGLDVHEVEPLPADSPLRGMHNVMLLPHLGGPTIDRRRDAGAFALENLRAFIDGRTPDALVSPQVYDSAS
ncbi:MAG TPA: NAD(P)-dependent oxidoreductase [Opitutaceae bacterium]